MRIGAENMSRSADFGRASEQARATLQRLYDLLSARDGRRPPSDEFFPVNLEAIAETVLGWKVKKVPFIFEDTSGKFDPKKREIVLPMDVDSDRRVRFTLAHEIGHIVLHSADSTLCGLRVPDLRSVRLMGDGYREPDKRVEDEANSFATELLMPAKAVRAQFTNRFGKNRVWCGSAAVREALNNPSGRRRLAQTGAPTPGFAAEALADYVSPTGLPPLTTYFGVSRQSLSIRLLELHLVY